MTPEWAREFLLAVTSWPRDPELSGLLFALSLVVSDHLFGVVDRGLRWAI